MVQEFHYHYYQEIIVFSHTKNSTIMDFNIITLLQVKSSHIIGV